MLVLLIPDLIYHLNYFYPQQFICNAINRWNNNVNTLEYNSCTSKIKHTKISDLSRVIFLGNPNLGKTNKVCFYSVAVHKEYSENTITRRPFFRRNWLVKPLSSTHFPNCTFVSQLKHVRVVWLHLERCMALSSLISLPVEQYDLVHTVIVRPLSHTFCTWAIWPVGKLYNVATG